MALEVGCELISFQQVNVETALDLTHKEFRSVVYEANILLDLSVHTLKVIENLGHTRNYALEWRYHLMIEAWLEESHRLLILFDDRVLMDFSNVLEINHFAVLIIVDEVIDAHLEELTGTVPLNQLKNFVLKFLIFRGYALL
jgi:hypothetical protein